MRVHGRAIGPQFRIFSVLEELAESTLPETAKICKWLHLIFGGKLFQNLWNTVPSSVS